MDTTMSAERGTRASRSYNDYDHESWVEDSERGVAGPLTSLG